MGSVIARRFSHALAAVALMVAAAPGTSCGGSQTAAAHCTPGASVGCVGPGGCTGYQVCKDDGSGLETCRCGTAGASGGGSSSSSSSSSGLADASSSSGASSGPSSSSGAGGSSGSASGSSTSSGSS